ncbi:hypothetical protein [Streptomyces sp. KLOTTS4A1]|uniref:hypothetical protein n=1 Tax=Streptomyces sp. KLOTTS4A1 TaxID=3390996 RepID=UPI0039F5E5E1
MNASDQEAAPTEGRAQADGATGEADRSVAEAGATTGEAEGEATGTGRSGLTPRQARRLRITAASALMVLAAVVLAIRLASRSSVLVVGVYGLLLVLCGVVIELSRRGRTRLGTYLLGTGLVAALLGDWVVLP